MSKINTAAIFAALLLIAAAPAAMAFSTESGPVNSDGSSQIVDPDDQLEEMTNPPANATGGGTQSLGAPIGNGGSLSTFWGVQPPPTGGQLSLPGDPGN